jgi:CRP-like cAMP-binding protein
MVASASELHKFLAQVDPFRALPATELDRLVALSKPKHYEKGETIYSEGDPADSVWVLQLGRIQIFKYSSAGRPLAIESLGPKELFGTLCRLGGNGRNYPCTAVTATPCDVLQILDRTFLDFYNRFPAMVMGVCALCSQRLNEMQGISCAGQEPVEKRIAGILLQLQRTHGTVLPVTKREVAELAGTTVETTIRTVSVFSKKGWVQSSRGKITLKNPAEIQKLVNSVC